MSRPENRVMRSQGMETLISIARDPCELSGHRYHPTWDMGHFLCPAVAHERCVRCVSRSGPIPRWRCMSVRSISQRRMRDE